MARMHGLGIAFVLIASLVNPVSAQTKEKPVPLGVELFLAGYNYGKLFRYYGRSLANFDTLSERQKHDDRNVMIDLSVYFEVHVKALGCNGILRQAIHELQSELSARGKPREFRQAQISSVHHCIDRFDPVLRAYWWTGRSTGSLAFLFENLERPQVDLRPHGSDRVLIEELRSLWTNAYPLFELRKLPPRAEQILEELSTIRGANQGKEALDTATRQRIKQNVVDLRQAFCPGNYFNGCT